MPAENTRKQTGYPAYFLVLLSLIAAKAYLNAHSAKMLNDQCGDRLISGQRSPSG